MSQRKTLQFSSEMFLYPLLIVLAIWISFWLQLRFGLGIRRWGIYPQKIEGLRGVIFGPFIHGSLKHLFNNSVPLLVLTMALFYFYRNIRWKVLLWGTLLSGLLTWSFARPALHIGASGVVYMLAAFLFFKGIWSKHFRLTALSLVVVFLYGSLLWYLFPIDPKISWEGHLSGFAVGIVLSLIFRKNILEKKKYEWEQDDYVPEDDPFLQQFDENGNFIEKPKPPKEDIEEIPLENRIRIKYIFKPSSEEE